MRLCVRITVPLLRDLVMLVLGSAGMAHELFLVHEPNMLRLSVSIGLLLGPTALYSVWRMRNPTQQPTSTGSGGGPPSPP